MRGNPETMRLLRPRTPEQAVIDYSRHPGAVPLSSDPATSQPVTIAYHCEVSMPEGASTVPSSVA